MIPVALNAPNLCVNKWGGGVFPGSFGLAAFDIVFSDLGSGAVNTTPRRGGVSATYARAGVAQALLGGANAGTFGQVAANTARSWYTNAGLLALGYMAEGARVNLCVQSQNFGASWVAIGTPTRTGGTTVLGTVQLDTIGDDDPAALEGYSLAVTFTGDAVKSVGVFVKQGTSTSSVVRIRDGTAVADRLLAAITWSGSAPVVTMTTGTDLTGTMSAAQLGTSGAYWLKFATTSVTAANSHQIEMYPATTAALAVGNTGTVQMGVVNEEDATFPSSPIITTGATVTRNADVLTYPTSPWLSATAGTFFVAGRNGVFSGTQQIISVNDTTTNEIIAAMQRAADSLSINHVAIDGGVGQVAMSISNTADNAAIKDAMAYATNDYAAALNGGAVSTDTSATLATVTEIDVGHRNGTLQYFGTISRTTYWPRRLGNAVLQAITV